ncbi:MAG TPA: glycoside hydrolase family 5 protein [Draconibacterium sp.]|nr:glycoside hydrolase family 5 protein [Draconibacterium sp.]HRX10956.1 glycoside hydrolase family 5 protein [Draconibacterium sp.]
MKLKHVLFSAIIFVVTIGFINAQPVNTNGKLSVKETFLVNEKGNAIVLRGVSYGWHNWWPRFYNKESVKWLADDWKCTVVRAAMGVGPKGSYTDKKEWSKEKIEAVVDGAIESGIYVIIDWHSHEIKQDEAVAFFTEMAEKYGKYPNVIYEIFNEPVNDSWEKVKNYSIAVIKAIREKDPDNIILVGSPHWDQDIHLVADSPITGFTNLMYTVHFYAATHGQQLRERSDYALKKGIPIFVSECAGMEASGNGPIDYKSWNTWIDWMETNKISWVTWSVADKNETCSMMKTTAGDTGNWKDEDLKESGIKTREKLREFDKRKQ